MNNRTRLLAATLLVSLPTFARAALVQYQFSGTLTEVPVALAGEFSTGESITGTFSVETTLNGFLYDASGLVVKIGGDYDLTGAAGAVRVLNDFGSMDMFHASFDGPLTAPSVGGLSPVEFDFALTLPSTAFSSTEVPMFIPLAGALGQSSIDFAPDDAETLVYRVNSVTVVPEPSLTVMLGAGALLLANRRRVGAR